MNLNDNFLIKTKTAEVIEYFISLRQSNWCLPYGTI